MLLEGGVGINMPKSFDDICVLPNWALRIALTRGYESIARLLLGKIIKFNLTNNAYGVALRAAGFGGLESMVRILLDKKTSILLKNPGLGYTLTGVAVRGHENIVRILLEQGAAIDGSDGHRPALQGAAANGHNSIV
jgi:hypothetical protein